MLKGSETVSVSGLLSKFNRGQMTIPNNYQRDYSWALRKKKEKSALDVFLEDFLKGFVSGNLRFYIANSIGITNEAARLSDGQQRLTTIFIFGLYLIHQLNDKKKQDFYSRDFFMVDDKLKLKQSVSDWDRKFQKTIQLKYTEDDDDIVTPIKEAQRQIASFIEKNSKHFDCEKWINYLLDKVDLNIIYIPDENEQEYFEDINTKGVKLTKFDILKSKILCKCISRKPEEKWQLLISKINKLSIYYKSRSSNSLEELVLMWTLFSLRKIDSISVVELEKCIDNSEDIGDLIIDTANKIVDLAIKIYRDEDSQFEALRYLNGGMFISLYSRVVLSGKLTPREAINYTTYLLLRYGTSDKNDLIRVFDAVKNISPIEVGYEEMLREERFRYKKGPNKYIKTILSIIDSHLRGSEFEISPSISIEHIRSQQFEDGNWVNDLGNLTLLTKNENSKLNNEQEKYDIYKKSQYDITRTLTNTYHAKDDKIRMFRSYYLPEMTSGDIDRFNEDDCIRRGKLLIEAVYYILGMKEINKKLI